jgi:hypothetical protein
MKAAEIQKPRNPTPGAIKPIQRPVFFEPGVMKQEAPPQPALLTEEEIRTAIRYNRAMYPPAQLSILQAALGISPTGRSDRETALAIARYQDNDLFLAADGKAGPETFSTIHGDTTMTNLDNLVMFNVQGSGQIDVTAGSGTTDMLGHFTIDIHLPPDNCEDYEYRQYICGDVNFIPAGGGTEVSLNNIFTTQPGGRLPAIPNYHQDGNTALNAIYGRRDRPARPENRYVDDEGNTNQATGCRFLGEDFPGITGRITNSGEVYDFDFRFMGEVIHKTRGRVAQRWWNIQSTFSI